MALWRLRALSALFWVFVTTSSIAIFPFAAVVWLLTLPFDRRKVVLHQFTCVWASLYTWLNPAWSVSIIDRKKLRADRPTVLVANHLSLIDILVIFRIFSHFKWVSKIENFRVPCVGWNMSMNGYIKLVRGNRASVIRMIARCKETLAAGSSIMMFPEGTRSASGQLRDFKPGAFQIALEARAPIQPLVIDGSADALPKRGFVLRGRHPITVTILDAIAYEDFAHMSADELAIHVRGSIAEHLEAAAKQRELEVTRG